MSAIDSSISSVLAIKQAANQQKLQTAVMAKQLDVTRQQGAAIVEMLTKAAQLNTSLFGGESVDTSI